MTINIMKNVEETTLELAGRLNTSAAYELDKTKILLTVCSILIYAAVNEIINTLKKN